MASQSDKSAEHDPLLEALESIRHLLDQSELGNGTQTGAATDTQTKTAQPAAAKVAPPPRTPPDPVASGELDLPVLDEVVMPGKGGERMDAVALRRALNQLQEDIARSIDLTLQQAAAQIADRLKQDLQRRINAIVKNLEK